MRGVYIKKNSSSALKTCLEYPSIHKHSDSNDKHTTNLHFNARPYEAEK
jgi:hypothetical protein